jgi:hypothetical protein
MITLYRTADCPRCSAIQEVLEGMTLAHKVVIVEDAQGSPVPHASRLPVLEDEGKVIEGRDAILQHLDQLAGFKAEWEKFQTDACYCDDEGNVE